MQDSKLSFSDDMKAKGYVRRSLWMKSKDWDALSELLNELGYRHPGSMVAKLIAEKLKEQR